MSFVICDISARSFKHSVIPTKLKRLGSANDESSRLGDAAIEREG